VPIIQPLKILLPIKTISNTLSFIVLFLDLALARILLENPVSVVQMSKHSGVRPLLTEVKGETP